MLFSLCLFCLTLVKPLECVDLQFNQIWNILYYCVQNCDSQPLFFLDSILCDRIQLLFHSSLWLFLCIVFFFNLCSISIVIPSFIIILYVYFLCKFSFCSILYLLPLSLSYSYFFFVLLTLWHKCMLFKYLQMSLLYEEISWEIFSNFIDCMCFMLLNARFCYISLNSIGIWSGHHLFY